MASVLRLPLCARSQRLSGHAQRSSQLSWAGREWRPTARGKQAPDGTGTKPNSGQSRSWKASAQREESHLQKNRRTHSHPTTTAQSKCSATVCPPGSVPGLREVGSHGPHLWCLTPGTVLHALKNFQPLESRQTPGLLATRLTHLD